MSFNCSSSAAFVRSMTAKQFSVRFQLRNPYISDRNTILFETEKKTLKKKNYDVDVSFLLAAKTYFSVFVYPFVYPRWASCALHLQHVAYTITSIGYQLAHIFLLSFFFFFFVSLVFIFQNIFFHLSNTCHWHHHTVSVASGRSAHSRARVFVRMSVEFFWNSVYLLLLVSFHSFYSSSIQQFTEEKLSDFVKDNNSKVMTKIHSNNWKPLVDVVCRTKMPRKMPSSVISFVCFWLDGGGWRWIAGRIVKSSPGHQIQQL